jgi:uncharacterized protein with beta-barrel porin domain
VDLVNLFFMRRPCLENLTINNPKGAALNANNYLNSLSINSTALTIGGGATTDVSNSVDLTSKTLNVGIADGENPFGKIKSAAQIVVDNQTKIGFSYSKNSASLQPGNSYRIVEAGGEISGNVANIVVFDDSYLFKNSLIASGNNIDTVIAVDEANFNLQNLGDTNYAILTKALKTDLQPGIFAISSQKELKTLTENLTPTNNAAQISSVIFSNRNFMKNADFSNDSNSKKIGEKAVFWGKVFGNNIKQKSRKNTLGYFENGGGLSFGIDGEISSKSKIGAAIGNNKNNISADTTNKNQIGIDNYQLTIYNKNGESENSHFYNQNAVLFSLNRYDTHRRITAGTFDKVARGKFSTNSQAARIGFGYNQKIGNFFIDPNFAIEHFRISGSSYRETNASNAGMAVKIKSLSGQFFDLGLKIGYRTKYHDYDLAPKFNVNLLRTAKSYHQNSAISFLNQDDWVNNNSIALQRSVVSVGAGIKIEDGEDDFVNLQIDGQIAEKMVGVSYMAKYVHRF